MKQSPPKTPDVAVIGAGPAGLFAAIRAARSGARVVVLEKQSTPGRKILASGGGHCNITNTLSEPEFSARFGRKAPYIKHARGALSSTDLLQLLADWGVPCHAPDGFHYFPKSNRAEDVLSALLKQLTANHVRIHFNSVVSKISGKNGAMELTTSDGTVLTAAAVILATGGAGYPGLGGSGSGYELAESAGHTIVPPVPGLVGLQTAESWPGTCTGLVVPAAEVRILHPDFKRQRWKGDLLFTHRGVSGPCILDASASVCRLLAAGEPVRLQLALAGGNFQEDVWRAKLLEWRNASGKRTVLNQVSTQVPRRLAQVICSECGIAEDLILARLPEGESRKLISLLTSLLLTIADSEGFDHAMVTAGGISLKEVHAATLVSRRMPGLYFAGESLDVDGPCGGFNLQWAASSGWLAGKSATARNEP